MEQVNPAEVGLCEERLGRIERVMQRYIDEGKVAGVVTMVARRGKLAQCGVYGSLDLKRMKPMRREALFRVYSMTKPIVSAAAMMLFEEGRWRLNEPIAQYIPAFAEMKVCKPRTGVDFDLAPAQRPITIRDLLTHTSGLSYGFEPYSWLDDLYRRQLWGMREDPASGNPRDMFSDLVGISQNPLALAEFVEELARLPLAHQPGSAFRYSFAIDVIGRLIEVISGQTLDVFLAERVFEPLGMKDTAFWTPPEKVERFTEVVGPTSPENPILRVIDPAEGSPFTKPAHFLSGGGGLVSTADDYLRFCQMLLNAGELEGTRLLGRKTVELMFSNNLPAGVAFEPGAVFGIGGAVQVDPAQGQWLGSAGRWSWGGAATTQFWIDPKEQLVGILMTQYMGWVAPPIQYDFNNLVYQAVE